MRRITLREDGDLRYADVLREVIRRPLDPKQGADITELRQSIRVLDVLEAANGTLELEDADYDHLKRKLEAMTWNVVDKRVLRLVDEVTSATETALL